jgi:hypothetical protein
MPAKVFGPGDPRSAVGASRGRLGRYCQYTLGGMLAIGRRGVNAPWGQAPCLSRAARLASDGALPLCDCTSAPRLAVSSRDIARDRAQRAAQ